MPRSQRRRLRIPLATLLTAVALLRLAAACFGGY